MSCTTSLGDVTVKIEPHCGERIPDGDYTAVRVEEIQIKLERESDYSDDQHERAPPDLQEVTVKSEDPHSLYEGHEVKVELVIGPEILQQPLPEDTKDRNEPNACKCRLQGVAWSAGTDAAADTCNGGHVCISENGLSSPGQENCPSSSTDKQAISMLTKSSKCPATKKRWVSDINMRREDSSEYHSLCRELESHEDRFFLYFQMSRNSFEELHDLVKPSIHKMDTNYRKAIGTRERLVICLRYIRTGDSFGTISLSFRLGRTTVSEIVEEVSKAIWEILQPTYMPNPTEQIWKQSELGYREICNFPNCVGSLEGKHVKMKCPNNSINHSIVMLAIADPFYKFTMVDIGRYGLHSDSNIFENSSFYLHYLHKKKLLPPKPLPGTNEPVPHVLIGNEGFVLQPYLMRPFPKATSKREPRQRKYNHRLCRARRMVEKTFDILTENWRVFHRPMQCTVEKAIHVTKAACCLHNYVMVKHGMQTPSQNLGKSALLPLRHTNARSPSEALCTREKFVSYFNHSNIIGTVDRTSVETL